MRDQIVSVHLSIINEKGAKVYLLPLWRLAYYATEAAIEGVPQVLLNPCAVDGGR
jgi:hypothetical protein